MTNRSWPQWLAAGALFGGTCDITYATTFNYLRSGVAPARVLKFVASGALGKDALSGGAGTAAIGLGFHYLNAFIIMAILFAAASQFAGVRSAIRRSPLMSGLGYGAVVFVVMTFVVVPLSRIGPRPAPPFIVWSTGLVVHMFLIGLPMVIAARRAFADRA
ncbi:MAG TPA: hypothetical protein VF483_01310 [Gemmatimonadaceae bacterium]